MSPGFFNFLVEKLLKKTRHHACAAIQTHSPTHPQAVSHSLAAADKVQKIYRRLLFFTLSLGAGMPSFMRLVLLAACPPACRRTDKVFKTVVLRLSAAFDKRRGYGVRRVHPVP